MNTPAPTSDATTTQPTSTTLDPRIELEALHASIRDRGDLRVTEYMLNVRWLRVRIRETGRYVAAKRLGINWLVWCDGTEMQRVGGGHLAETFLVALTVAARRVVR